MRPPAELEHMEVDPAEPPAVPKLGAPVSASPVASPATTQPSTSVTPMEVTTTPQPLGANLDDCNNTSPPPPLQNSIGESAKALSAFVMPKLTPLDTTFGMQPMSMTSSDTSGSSSEEQGTFDSSEDQGALSSAPEDMGAVPSLPPASAQGEASSSGPKSHPSSS